MSVHMRTLHTKERIRANDPVEEKSKPWREALGLTEREAIGHALAGFRYKNKMTQAELAKKLGISQHHISEMEHAKKSLGRGMARRLAKIFKIDYRIFL